MSSKRRTTPISTPSGGDVADGTGYVLRVEGVIAGYMCIDFSGEPAYTMVHPWPSAGTSGEWGW
ncbi:hypothetical protein [Oscillibacter sp.]|uniref:hypothetical protein n=1 Tax=Oscillibacter sp. TaxID=1945593 RepID=UPI00216FEFD6|nr:hypothetical protein [Oscillibacter sp.]MCI9649460.1 hypothetical protein [Oscillibacter sp.]